MHKRIPFVEFVVSAFSERDFPRDPLPQVVMAGRSNVGKSSLINRLVRNQRLARTSSTPGKTQSINFYRVDNSFFLVDLPGFGYSVAGRAASREWKKLIESYLRKRSDVALVVHLIDARMAPTELDLELVNWLKQLGIARVTVAKKADKLSGNGRAAQMRAISNCFGGEPVILSSAITGMGCNEIWNRIMGLVLRP